MKFLGSAGGESEPGVEDRLADEEGRRCLKCWNEGKRRPSTSVWSCSCSCLFESAAVCDLPLWSLCRAVCRGANDEVLIKMLLKA